MAYVSVAVHHGANDGLSLRGAAFPVADHQRDQPEQAHEQYFKENPVFRGDSECEHDVVTSFNLTKRKVELISPVITAVREGTNNLHV
jgi:hypothetical protein